MFKVIQLYRIFQNRQKVSQSQQSVSVFFLLNQAALDYNCFSINGCYGYKNGGYSKDKFSFFLYWETVCIKTEAIYSNSRIL